ncbi:MAG: endonuclease III [Propionibacteriaceae bacterium]|jgi:endonuclease-3|nr:endonuclease III [Propionibacteriaceae bacterium]
MPGSRPYQVFEILGELYPDAHCELDYADAYQLIVAVMLSAQCTDVRVNQVTPALFARYPDFQALAAADRAELEGYIRPTGFFRHKADALLQVGAALASGEVPRNADELVRLHGIGRKSANVILAELFDVPGLTTDTHFIRLSNRLGWVDSKNPDVVERVVGKLFQPADWNTLNHRLIWHGRRRCHARKPDCLSCPVSPLCPYFWPSPQLHRL